MVRMTVLDERDILVVRDTKASCCNRKCLPGQSVLAGYAGGSRFAIHRRCLVKLLGEMPLDGDEQAFQELRDSIVASGNIFEPERV